LIGVSRRIDSFARTHEKRCLKLIFNGLNLSAQRRLRHAQRLGGAAEIAVLDHRKEVLDFSQVHGIRSRSDKYTFIE
jgi:hypothetical protein